MKYAIHHIHFVGIGGAGMSGIAEVLHNLGYAVSGSDLADSATLRRLAGLGITTHVGHEAAHIEGADAVVTSTAVQADNPEVLAARARKIPVVPRALMLAELMRFKQGIAIAGAFVDFLHRMPFYGRAILCVDSPAVREILPQVARPVTTYGFAEDAQVRAMDVRAEAGRMRFTVRRQNGQSYPDIDVVLSLPGEHNVLNALSAVAVAMELEIPDEALLRAFESFKGVGRRFQRHGELPAADGGSFTVIDDYGHHPVEMAATLAAARGAFPGRRLVLAFQPHRYSRTRDCFEDFVKVIGLADAVLLTEVYAAGEAPVVAADGRSLARALRVAGRVEPVFVEDVAELPAALAAHARDGDVLLCMGAGSIGAVPGKLVEMLQKQGLQAQQGAVQ
jgi:UDP-N-acetylmuramate--alanine ligase